MALDPRIKESRKFFGLLREFRKFISTLDKIKDIETYGEFMLEMIRDLDKRKRFLEDFNKELKRKKPFVNCFVIKME